MSQMQQPEQSSLHDMIYLIIMGLYRAFYLSHINRRDVSVFSLFVFYKQKGKINKIIQMEVLCPVF